MTIDMNDMLNSILNELSHLQYVHPGDIPNIDLYMDQVTTFMDEQLASTKRYKEDKILDQQLYKEQSSSAACEEEVFPGAYAASHFYLLF